MTGAHGIPGTATAITGNLTVTQQTAAGYLAVTRDADRDARHVDASTSRSATTARQRRVRPARRRRGRSRSCTSRASAGAQTHVILDITGYFEPGTGGLRFVPLNPGRVMDTRGTPSRSA